MGFGALAVTRRTRHCQNESVLALAVCAACQQGTREQWIRFATEKGAWFSCGILFFCTTL